VLVTRRDLALEVLRDPGRFTVDDPRFSTARVIGPSILSLDGPEHARRRRPVAQAFRPPRVHELTASVAAEIDARLAALRPPADLARGFAAPLAAAVVTRALGLDLPAERALAWYAAIVRATAEDDPDDASRAAMDELRAAVGGRHEASDAAVAMFGGIETTEGMIANALHLLLTHPEQLALVRADPALVPAAIEESLRLEPAAALVDRYATRATTLGGEPVAERELVTVSLRDANRDARAFREPERFDVRRTDADRHLAFAHGPHVCLGAQLARLEARLAVGAVVGRLDGLRLLDPGEARPQGEVFRKPRALRATWIS
jgi:cytochrome P450